ncbi:hypothetical protein QEG98_10105 [Myxococcus sp. MxC21-1]|nr:hypothetical protein [Myxococcus sp. MxC21-1]WNZ64008.1 hypothetical protein QEG98_10105 [Myxococcus sp. MxC21-1]
MRKSKSSPSDAKRCAVYTRKSTAAGLEMEFNSLDAQRESCVSYVQRQPGWVLVDESYDDGGFTGLSGHPKPANEGPLKTGQWGGPRR